MTDQDAAGLGGLQFDRADFGTGTPSSLACTTCSLPIDSVYFEAGGQIVCQACRDKLQAFMEGHAGLEGVLQAIAAGAGAAILGCLIYYAVLALTGYEFGLIAILVGYLVGRAVRWGSGNRGGVGFQVMAVVLTYLSIVGSYVPLVVREVRQIAAKQAQQTAPLVADTPAAPAEGAKNAPPSAGRQPAFTGGEVAKALAMFGLFILALPFLQGVSNIIGIAIIGFALWQAWKLNRRVSVEISGPFTPGAAQPA